MITPRRMFMGTLLGVVVLICEGRSLGEWTQKDSISEPTKTVVLLSSGDNSFVVSLDSFRTRFCADNGRGPCYDYEWLYVQIDSCGVTAFPLRKIVSYENQGEFTPNYCICATQSSVLTTTDELNWKVYVQERYWSIVGIEVGTGETVELPLSELASFQKHWNYGL